MEIILIVYLVVSIALIGIILLQQGKGAEMGASFGAGGANTVFGAAGSGNVLTKSTTILAILFFAIALGISYLNSESTVVVDSVIDEVPVEESQPATSIEAELPQTEGGLEAEVAPMQEAEAVEKNAKEALETVTAKEAKTEQEKEEAKKGGSDK